VTSLLTPTEIIGDRYQIDAYVDAGGMQEVYRASDLSLQRIVALKVPKNESATKRFQRSAALSAKVTHPNIAKTYDYLIDNGRQYLVEEFVDGNDLRSRLRSHYFYLDPHLAAHVFHHLVKGLAAVHRVGVIHRDLKPSNIMVSTDPDIETVKITDFGVAKMAQAEVEEAIGNEEATMGSPTVVGALPYMAPEVIQSKSNISPSADVWSVGAILYQLLTGVRPFGEGLPAVNRIIQGEMTPKPAMLTQNSQFIHLTEEIWAIILKCLTADPLARPSADELVKLCGSLCYSRHPRSLGVVTRYAEDSGDYGFIRYDDSGNTAFFHGTAFWSGTPSVGTRVSFAAFAGTPQLRAFPVLALRPE
jgi:serine/threonine protein kinase